MKKQLASNNLKLQVPYNNINQSTVGKNIDTTLC